MRDRLLVLALAGTALLAACEKHEFEPPSREGQVAQADSSYSPALFDSITWASDTARAAEGNNVFATHCRKCHGPLGKGATEYAAERDLDVPSLVEPDWEFSDDLEGARHRIFTGHPAGMPTWGVAGITPREIDAVAYYVIRQLRPEVMDSASR
jgi:mono/diheme cytochrome c family protein